MNLMQFDSNPDSFFHWSKFSQTLYEKTLRKMVFKVARDSCIVW